MRSGCQRRLGIAAPRVVGSGSGLLRPASLLEDVVDTRIERLVISRYSHRLGRVEDLERQAFLAVQQFDAAIGMDHHGHRFFPQRIARLAVRLQDVALPVERQHQILGELALVMNRADPRQPEGVARVGDMGIALVFRHDGKAAVMAGQIAAQEGIRRRQVVDAGKS